MNTVGPAPRAIATADLASHLPQLRAALEEQRQFRMEQLSALAEAATRRPATVDDVHEQVSEVLRSGAAKALAEVEDALARMQAGRYGACGRCGTSVALERLEILPMSRYCMRCQHAVEGRPA